VSTTTTTTWVFDVDGCLIDSLTGSSLRPGARELLEDLGRRAQILVAWSAGGAPYARRRAAEHDVSDLFNGFYAKSSRDEDRRYVTSGFLAGLTGVVFVDDRPEDMPVGAEVITVRPYLAPNPHDRGLEACLQHPTLLTLSGLADAG
jgi:long-chain acyl-CoA synthetase